MITSRLLNNELKRKGVVRHYQAPFPGPGQRNNPILRNVRGPEVVQTSPVDLLRTGAGGEVGRFVTTVGNQVLDGQNPNVTKAIEDMYGTRVATGVQRGMDVIQQQRKKKRPTSRLQSTSTDTETDTSTGTQTATGTRGRGRSRGRGGGGDNRRPGQPPSRSSNRGFGNSYGPFGPFPAGSKITLTGAMDHIYHKNQLISQVITGDDIPENRLKVLVNVIGAQAMNFDDNIVVKQAWLRVYSQLKQMVNMETNGGTASTKTEFTYDNVLTYLKYGMDGLMMISQLDAIQTWNPPYEESNLVMRDIKNAANSSVPLYKSRNRLQDALATMALPREILAYYPWLFQPYKKSPVEGGVTQIFRTTEFMEDIGCQSNDWSSTIARMDTLTDAITSLDTEDPSDPSKTVICNLDKFSVITSLLIKRTDSDYIVLRNRDGAIEYPCYDPHVNCVIDNLPIFGSTNTQYYGYNAAGRNKTLPVAFCVDKDNVPMWVSAHLLLNYADGDDFLGNGVFGTANGGFPMFSTPKYYNTVEVGGCINGSTSRYVLEQVDDAGYPYGFKPLSLNNATLDISDHIYNITEGNTLADGTLIPRGLNTRMFRPEFDSLTTSCASFLYNMFGISEDYSR